MSQEYGKSIHESALEARRETAKRAGQVAIALLLRSVPPQVSFESTVFGRSTPAQLPLPGWVVDERKYVAGMRPGGALEDGQVLARELLLLGTDKQLRTAYAKPREGYQDERARRVFNTVGVEGWKLHIDGERRALPLRALRDHDDEGFGGDYFLSHGPTLYERNVPELSIASEKSVQRALDNLAREYDVADIVGAPTGY